MLAVNADNVASHAVDEIYVQDSGMRTAFADLKYVLLRNVMNIILVIDIDGMSAKR